jgi:hypothetical protein
LISGTAQAADSNQQQFALAVSRSAQRTLKKSLQAAELAVPCPAFSLRSCRKYYLN